MRSFFMLKTEDINNMGPYCAIITILKYLVRKGLDSNTRQKGRFRPYDVLMLLKLILFCGQKCCEGREKQCQTATKYSGLL